MKRKKAATADVPQLSLQLDLFAGSAATETKAAVIPFRKDVIAEAVEVAIKPRNTRNFRITDELDTFPGDDQKFLRNIEAIQLLKTLAAEAREATLASIPWVLSIEFVFLHFGNAFLFKILVGGRFWEMVPSRVGQASFG